MDWAGIKTPSLTLELYCGNQTKPYRTEKNCKLRNRGLRTIRERPYEDANLIPNVDAKYNPSCKNAMLRNSHRDDKILRS